jgi:hypothetical protein
MGMGDECGDISTASGLLQVAILELRGGSTDCFMIKPPPGVAKYIPQGRGGRISMLVYRLAFVEKPT